MVSRSGRACRFDAVAAVAAAAAAARAAAAGLKYLLGFLSLAAFEACAEEEREDVSR